MKKNNDNKTKVPKIIWMYWEQEFDNAPFVVKKCVQSWQRENPDWEIKLLDSTSINNYITIDLPEEKLSKLMLANKSDIIRLKLLSQYGGVWADATTYCTKPLNTWFAEASKSGFFAFYLPGEDRLLSTWFLISEKNSHLTKKWFEKLFDYWYTNNYIQPTAIKKKLTDYAERYINRSYTLTKYWFSPIFSKVLRIYPYFAVHYIFERVVSTDKKANDIWERTPKISADGPHSLQKIGLMAPLNKKVKTLIDTNEVAVYKLTYRGFDESLYPNSILYYLFEGQFKEAGEIKCKHV